MKRTFILSLMIFFITGIAHAQTKTPPTPATLNEVSYYNKGGNSLVALEKGKAEFVTKVKGFGLGGATTNYELQGDKSSVRIAASDSLSFIVSMADGTGDPSTWYMLFKTDVKKNKRIANYVNTKVYGGKSGSGDGIIPYSVRSLGNHAFEIIPSTKLEKGEYFFVNQGTSLSYGGKGVTSFAFGID
ncbi:MAG: hypothetical protein NTW29_01700 [Bacteroidetes bacterium]|nr:hypothetical protein [Bacteroidota bacterium]